METTGLYLLKSASWLTGFALVYLLFLRKERFFVLKRIYLVSGMIISFLFPLITFHYNVDVPVQQPDAAVFDSQLASPAPPAYTSTSALMHDGPGWQGILLILYLAGVIFFLIRTLVSLIKLFRSVQKAEVRDAGKVRLIRSPFFKASFSFFNYVFLSTSVCEAEAEHIMNHEKVHVEQKHWLDLVLAEMLRMFQWVNPFAWIYNGLIRQNLEHLADREALELSADPAVYRAVLVNQMFRAPVFNLANSFSYSVNRQRFEMMKKIITSPYRKLKLFLVLPVFAIVFYAFSAPEYNYIYSTSTGQQEDFVIEKAPVFQQNDIKGIVLNESGTPVAGASITSTGPTGFARNFVTGSDGRFSIQDVMSDASLLVFCRGYKQLTLKPVFNENMTIRLVVDPEYKATPSGVPARPQPLVAIDGVPTDKEMNVARRELGYNFGSMRMLSGQEAIDKYGEKAAGGVYEITTRSKAIEMGQNPPMARLGPDDYPTFQGMRHVDFDSWVRKNIAYPKEATEGNIDGWVIVSFVVEADGSISNINANPGSNKVLASEVIKVISTAPKWTPAVNENIREPFSMSVNVGFSLPDRILDIAPFVVVENMPMFPGGDVELLRYLAENTNYPPEAKANKIEGRVIVRFSVKTDGGVEFISVLKGVDPLLDAEAMRVVSTLKGFRPGMQGGKAVPVWYMVPITFTLND